MEVVLSLWFTWICLAVAAYSLIMRRWIADTTIRRQERTVARRARWPWPLRPTGAMKRRTADLYNWAAIVTACVMAIGSAYVTLT